MEPKRFLDRILEAAIVLAASAYLIKLAACYLTQSWPTLAIIAVFWFVMVFVIPLVPAVVFFIFALIADSSGWVIAWCIAGVISLILYLIWVANNT